MDLPNVDLYQMLNPPAIVGQFKLPYDARGGLTSFILAQEPDAKKGRNLQKTLEGEVFAELRKPFRIVEHVYEYQGQRNLYQLLLDERGEKLVGGIVYGTNIKYHKGLVVGVYLREGKIPIIIVYRPDSISSKGADWRKRENAMITMEDSTGHFALRVISAYKEFRFLEERRKDEGRIMLAGAHVPQKVKRMRTWLPQKRP